MVNATEEIECTKDNIKKSTPSKYFAEKVLKNSKKLCFVTFEYQKIAKNTLVKVKINLSMANMMKIYKQQW